jgi:hypothetical protein
MIQRQVTALWRQVYNLPVGLGKLQTCRHKAVTQNTANRKHARSRIITTKGTTYA